jgi:hypothetical protein
MRGKFTLHRKSTSSCWHGAGWVPYLSGRFEENTWLKMSRLWTEFRTHIFSSNKTHVRLYKFLSR